jgi:hypothetical protein
MPATLPLAKMSVAEKLRAMDALWTDLLHTPASVPSPAWHADVLAAREARIKSGQSVFVDWAEAKETIRKRTR